MKTSAAGRDLIARNEGIKLTAYQDSVGVWTIGRGDTGPDVVEGLTITKEEADIRFANRLAREFEPAVMRGVGNAPTTQGQFDAMVSLAYNIGPGRVGTPQHPKSGFLGSSVLRLHNAGDYEGAADAFAMWNKAGGRVLAGLTRRRQEEADLYLSDVPPDAEAVPEPVAVRPVAAVVADDSSGVGHQKAVAGGLAVSVAQIADWFQSLFSHGHIPQDILMAMVAVGVAVVVWKVRHGGTAKG